MSPSARVNISNNTLYNNTTAGITSRDERDAGGTPVRQTSARVTLRNNIAHSNRVDFEIAKPFDEAYFCTGMTGVNPTGCASVTAALADPASNSVLGFTAADRCLYLGATDKFRGVAVTPLTPPSGSGADLQWDFWNGASWASLETVAPGTFRDYNFQWPGFAYAADDPSGWATRTVGAAVGARYYVRACYAGSASSPTEKLIVRADVTVASRYNLAKDKTGLYNSLWRGVGETGVESPAGPIGAGVSFVSATDLHIQSTSAARDAVVNQPRADGAQVAGIQNPRFTRDFDLQLRPLFSCPGDCWDIGADEYVPTTAVRLMSFDAVARDAAVELAWQTGSELDNLGFHLYRGPSQDGPWTRIDPALIPGLGSSATGKAYSYRDAGLQNGTRYFYRLEDVDASSKTTSHGPVSAVPLAGAAGGAPGSAPPSSSPSGKKTGASAPILPRLGGRGVRLRGRRVCFLGRTHLHPPRQSRGRLARRRLARLTLGHARAQDRRLLRAAGGFRPRACLRSRLRLPAGPAGPGAALPPGARRRGRRTTCSARRGAGFGPGGLPGPRPERPWQGRDAGLAGRDGACRPPGAA